MPTTNQLLIAYAIPASLSLILSIIAWRPWSSAAPRGHWAMPVVLGLALATAMVGFAYQYKPPGWPPAQAEDWLFWGAIAVLLVGVLDALVPLWGEVRPLLTVTLAAALCYLLIAYVTKPWPPYQVLTHLGGAAVLIAAVAVAIERTSEKNPGWIVPLVLTICFFGVAPWPLLHETPSFSFRISVLPIVLLPIVAIAAWAKHVTLSRGGAMAFAVLYGAILVMCKGRIPDTPTWQLIVLAAAPLVSLIPLWTPLSGWKKPVISLAIATAMVLSVVIPAVMHYRQQQAMESYQY
jgi:hypothetical protein